MKSKYVGAYDALRAQMDTLMGADRDVPADQKESVRKRAFTDPEIDRFHLCDCSPYLLLSQTKTETMLPQVQPPLEQDDRLKEEWDALAQTEKDKYGFEHETMIFLQDMVDEMDRRISSTRSRLDATSEPAEPEITPEIAQALQGLKDQIQELQVKAEVAGEQGDVDASVALNEQAEALTRRKADIEATTEAKRLQNSARRQCVCVVSGLIYAANDSDARIAELQSGRQYRGWKEMRDRLEALRAARPPRGAQEFERRIGYSRVAREREQGGGLARGPGGERDERPARGYEPRAREYRGGEHEERPYSNGDGRYDSRRGHERGYERRDEGFARGPGGDRDERPVRGYERDRYGHDERDRYERNRYDRGYDNRDRYSRDRSAEPPPRRY